ncbi:MAG: nickel transporter permease [Chitinophagales bacterium]
MSLGASDFAPVPAHTGPSDGSLRPPETLLGPALRRLKANRGAMLGLAIVLLLTVVALAAPLLARYDPVAPALTDRLQAPGPRHWLGTDDLGRDILARLIYGARVSLQVGLASVALALVLGVPLGAVAGYRGGWVDNLVMRAMDIMLAFPGILLAIAIVAILGPSLQNAMLAIGIVSIPIYARVMRGSVLALKTKEFVDAARSVGARDRRILWRHLVPNCLSPLIVQATLGVATAILDAAALSFLGLGAQPPTPEWGAMLSQGRSFLRLAPWVTLFPGLAIMLLVMGLNLLGDGLRDALDTRLGG